MAGTAPDRPAAVIRAAPAIPDREAEALAEIAATRVTAAAARVTIAIFLLVLLAGPLFELAAGSTTRRPRLAAADEWHRRWSEQGWRGANAVAVADIKLIGDYVERSSAISRHLRPPTQTLLTRTLGYGNGQVIVGRRRILFLQESLSAVAGPPFRDPRALARRQRPGAERYPPRDPDPLPALLRLGAQLRAGGTQLVLLLAPEKMQVYPEWLHGRDWRAPPRNPSLPAFVRALRSRGVWVYDAAGPLFKAARGRADLYTRTDSHWAPAGVDLVASGLARFLRRRLGWSGKHVVFRHGEPLRLELSGGLASLLGLPPRRHLAIAREVVTLRPVLWPDGRELRASATTAPIVLVGDSFSLVYTRGAAGTPVDAGLAEQLAFHLGRPVQMIATTLRNRPRDRAEWLAARGGPPPKIVIYEAAERLLSVRDWPPPAPAAAGAPRLARPAAAEPGRR